ncbi:MAG: hypothetical protein J3K34DRAFT_516645 [Monoraphidium minutum]|nr:MAG: hypothetical protein J3K34DRAFT_516645 [Monoraphidium minutum]
MQRDSLDSVMEEFDDTWVLCDEDETMAEAEGAAAPPGAGPVGAGDVGCGDEDGQPRLPRAHTPAACSSGGSSLSGYEAISPSSSWQDGLDEMSAGAVANTRDLLVRFFGPAGGGAAGAGAGGGGSLSASAAAAPPSPCAGGAGGLGAAAGERLGVRLTLAPAGVRLVLSLPGGGGAQDAGCERGPRDAKLATASGSDSDDDDASLAGSDCGSAPAPAGRRGGLGAAGGHLRVLHWLLPGLVFLVIGHLASSHASPPGCAAGGEAWGAARPGGGGGGAFGPLGGGGPVVVGACGAPGGEAVQLVFASYADCAGGRGACSGSWSSSGSGWSEGYSA